MSRYRPLLYALPNILLVLAIAGLIAGGTWIWAVLVITAIVGGPVDEAIGDDRRLLDPAVRRFFTANLYATLPLTIVLTVVYLNTFTDGDPIGLKAALAGMGIGFGGGPALTSAGPTIGAILMVAAFYAAGSIVVGHELIHWTGQKSAVEMGRGLLSFTLSAPFAIAHVYGHHRWVGTYRDHSTARRGESLLAFSLRAVRTENEWGCRIEADMMRRRGLNPWSWRNRAVWGYAYQFAIIVGAWLIAGLAGVAAFLGAALVAKLLQETMNYTQHYGIVRVEGAPIEARHSWDCYRTISNALFYNLPRHADHHVHGSRPAWELAAVEGSPMLPYGYKTMSLMALVPPLFRRVMDPRLAQWDRTMASEAERDIIRARGWQLAAKSTEIPVSANARL